MSKSWEGSIIDKVGIFLDNLDGGLADRLVGTILFGSHAKQNASIDSDIDLVVIIADVEGEHSRQEVFRILSASEVNQDAVSVSVETYMRIKDFLRKGDPFAWVVISEGKILRERKTLLTDLQKYCQSLSNGIEGGEALRYLQNKSYTHYIHAMQAFHQFLSNIQLSEMAGAQAVAVKEIRGKISREKLTDLADWDVLKTVLQETSATKREIEILEQLILAHKQIRLKGADDYIGKDIMTMVQTAGELWKRLLPQRKSEF